MRIYLVHHTTFYGQQENPSFFIIESSPKQVEFDIDFWFRNNQYKDALDSVIESSSGTLQGRRYAFACGGGNYIEEMVTGWEIISAREVAVCRRLRICPKV